MKKIKVIYYEIESCSDCLNMGHTGGHTNEIKKPCCNHPTTVKKKGNNCFKRIIKSYDELITGIEQFVRLPKKIPKWCPLDDKRKTLSLSDKDVIDALKRAASE